MRNLVRYLFIFALVFSASTVFHSPTAEAMPEFDIWTVYYDSALTEIGWQHSSCANSIVTSSGTTSGAGGAKWREIQTIRCEDQCFISLELFEYCGSYEVWVQVPTMGGATSC